MIVIGAGMAGIAAARTLQDAGLSVLVLEARDRIGGRTHTDHSLGPSIDLGAAWIHGPVDNPLTPLAERFGVTWGYTDFANESGDALMAFDSAGLAIDGDAYTAGKRRFSQALETSRGSTLFLSPSSSLSLAEVVASGLPGVGNLSAVEQRGYEYMAHVRAQLISAADPTQLDWDRLSDYTGYDGGDLLLIGGGYNGITDRLADGLDVRINSPVQRVEIGADGGRVVTSCVVVNAERVVVTVPLGVLQAGAIDFAPALPPDKQGAISRLGMGVYEKLILRFARRFWPKEPHMFNFDPGEEGDFFQSWTNFGHYTEEAILGVQHGGSRALELNHLGDEDLIQQALRALRTMFGSDLPALTGYLRTGWADDPFALGSYSFQKVGMRSDDRATLAAPVGDRLFFAGEATHPQHFSTVHGAYETGLRAAGEVLASLNP